MNRIPLVTIITPCYNGSEYLKQYFESILSQTYRNLELIFVNDGSEDETEQIALSYCNALEEKGIAFKYRNQEHGGQAKAMNTGFQEMTGEYLVWPDCDDVMTPDSIEKKVRFLEMHPEFGFVRSNGCFFDYNTKQYLYRISEDTNRFRNDIFLDLILERTYCCCGCYMIRTAELRSIYPNLRIYESSAGQNWQILIPYSGRFRCGYIDEDLYQVMVHSDSHSRVNRTPEQIINRYDELKRILENALTFVDRTELNYREIIRVKYIRMRFQFYIQNGYQDEGKKYYDELCASGSAEYDDHLLYLKKTDMAAYRWYATKLLGKRIIWKIARILKCQ